MKFILLISCLFSLISQAEPLPQESFGMAYSEGSSSSDQNILLSHQVGNQYTFKICRAFRPDGARTRIAEFRSLQFHSNQNPLMNGQSLFQYQSDLFQSEDCEPLSEKVYVLNRKILGAEGALENTPAMKKAAHSVAGTTGAAALMLTLGSLEVFVVHNRMMYRDNNTLSAIRTLRSSKIIKGSGKISLVSFLAAAGAGYFLYDQNLRDPELKDLSNFTEGTGTPLIVDGSMNQFVSHFRSALEIAEHENILKSL